MNGRTRQSLLACATLLLGLGFTLLADTAHAEQEPWSNLRQQFFGDRPIAEDNQAVIELEAPVRAEDAAIVPISIKDRLPPDSKRRIRTVYLIIDKNPGPVAAIVRFAPGGARADIATRIRINEYTNVRAIAETDDGQLYMSTRYVKASGGCSAPAAKDADAALARLGKMKLRVDENTPAGTPAQLMISHPNYSGLQKNQATGLYTPAYFVREITVRYAGRPVLTAETTFSLSENPSLHFYFIPHGKGELTAEAVDTKDKRFSIFQEVAPSEVRADGAN